MNTVTQPAPPRKGSSSEVTGVDLSPAAKGTGALYFLNIWQGSKLSTYWLLPLVCPDGIAYQFQASRTKPASEMQADSYDTALFLDGNTCDCPGHSRFGHCKHVSALQLLIDQGKLPTAGDRALPPYEADLPEVEVSDLPF